MDKSYTFWQRDGKELPESDTVSVLLVGDIMLGREVGKKIKEHGPQYPFKKIANILNKGDVVFGNLECPISNRGKPIPFVQSNFKADPLVVTGLKEAGFNVLSLANNHIYDYGPEAVEDTIKYLQESRIKHIGIGRDLKDARKPVIVSVGDVKIAFLAYTSAFTAINPSNEFVAPRIKLGWIAEDIQKVKKIADICIVSLHFGYEKISYPPPENRKKAKAIVEFGADLVVGHHPHVIQGIEHYKKGFIAYSLGDFVFDNLTEERKKSLILKVCVDKMGIRKMEIIPVSINENYQPELASRKLADEIFNRINELSNYFNDGTSDRMFWNVAKAKYLSDQRRAISRLVKKYGIIALFSKLKRLRFEHLKLILLSLSDTIKRRFMIWKK